MASEGTQVLRSYVVKVCEGSFLHTRGSFLVHALMTFLLFFFFSFQFTILFLGLFISDYLSTGGICAEWR